jgi:hypothetical protein
LDYLTLFSPHNLAMLSDWLVETRELYIDVHWPHSGGSGAAYFIHSIDDLKSLVLQQDRPEVVFTIFRRLQFPIRGIADERLLQKALEQIPDGEWYTIVSLKDVFPSNIARWGSGDTHAELRTEFADVIGDEIGIGQDPYDLDKLGLEALLANTEEVFKVSVLRFNDFAIERNQDFYEPYAKEPRRYKWVEELWRK